MIFLEALFVLLLAADTWLTYRIIALGKGVEIGPVAQYYIDNKAVAIILTVVSAAAIIALNRFAGTWPVMVLADLYMARLCWHNWKVLRG